LAIGRGSERFDLSVSGFSNGHHTPHKNAIENKQVESRTLKLQSSAAGTQFASFGAGCGKLSS